MKDLVDTTEMYLRTIYELEEEGIVPLRARIAERLEQSGPTVSQTVNRMQRDGLLQIQPDRSLEMTPKGRHLATAVMRKHRLAERLLVDVIGLDISDVHDEACRWEHVMSDTVERKVVELLDDPTTSPFGNPIPGLGELGADAEKADDAAQPHGIRACDLPGGTPVAARIVQFNEILQVSDTAFREIYQAGIEIGSVVEVEINDDLVTLSYNGSSIHMDTELGHAIRVEPVEGD